MSSTENDVKKWGESLKILRVEGEKSMSSMIQQTAIMAIQSAIKATAPGASGTLKGMAQKYKTRPLVPMNGIYMYANPKTGFIFKRPTPVSLFKSKGLVRITRGIQFWYNKKSGWGLIPYIKGFEFKKQKSLRSKLRVTQMDEKRKIPFFGAAKAGFMKAYRDIAAIKTPTLQFIYSIFGSMPAADEPFSPSGAPSRKTYATVLKRLYGYDQYVNITNEVEYAAKISPSAADTGLQKASSRMLKIFQRDLDRITAKANT